MFEEVKVNRMMKEVATGGRGRCHYKHCMFYFTLSLLCLFTLHTLHLSPLSRPMHVKWSSSSLISKSVSVWVLPASYPAWSTTEERAHLEQALVRWQHSVGLCAGCFSYHHKRLISPPATICAPTAQGKNPELFILVSTIHQHRVHRDLIRETWGSHTQNNTGRARLLFLFGKDPGGNLEDERLLQKEGAAHGDILQDDFNSTYRQGGEAQLIMGYHWVVQHCPNDLQVLKISDDVFVNIPKILELVSSGNLNYSVWGKEERGAKPVRDPQHRYYVSPELWPAAVFPNYCSGAFIGTPMAVVRKILLISPFLSWSAGSDDIIVGMCAEKLGIPTKNVKGFLMEKWNNGSRIPKPMYAVHFHGSAPSTLRDFWAKRVFFE